VGKGAAFSQADKALTSLVEATGMPFLATAMGRGVVPDSHPACVNAARSLALVKADVAIVFGARHAQFLDTASMSELEVQLLNPAIFCTFSDSCRGKDDNLKLGIHCLLSITNHCYSADKLARAGQSGLHSFTGRLSEYQATGN
jgi:hypothetical protein